MSSVAVVGAGTNGLTAACVAARAGLQVTVYEANDNIGGAARTQPLGDSPAVFDLGSAVHPMAMLSEAFHRLGVHQRVDFIIPELSYAHVNAQQRSYAWRDLNRTLDALPVAEAGIYRRIMGPLVQRINELGDTLLNPLLALPRHPLTLATFGASTIAGMGLLHAWPQKYPQAAALLAGCAAHVAGGSRGPAGTGAGLFLGAAAHGAGWAIPRGGSQAISDALANELKEHGGRIVTGRQIDDLRELDEDIFLLNTSAETAAKLGTGRIPEKLARRLRNPRRSPGSCVVHYVLREPVPWKDSTVAEAGTVHLGGNARQVVGAERHSRHVPVRDPFVLVSQPSQFDDQRDAQNRHVLWAYCHVPLGSAQDMSDRITEMLQDAAPGFKDTILEQHVRTATDLEQQNASLVGGDISGGTMDLCGSVVRPRLSPNPWWLESKGMYLISSAVPPGPSVHGMGGYRGAQHMLRREFGITEKQ